MSDFQRRAEVFHRMAIFWRNWLRAIAKLANEQADELERLIDLDREGDSWKI